MKRLPGSSPNQLDLMVDACPANLLAFGNTCPSNLQSLKRLILHNYLVSVLVPPPYLVTEDITSANSTFALCTRLGVALLAKKLQISKETKIDEKNRS